MGLTTLSPSRIDCIKILGVSISWNQLDTNRPEQGLPYLLPLRYKNSKETKTNLGTFHDAYFHFISIYYLSRICTRHFGRNT